MATEGSSASLCHLVTISGAAFFVRKDSDVDESEFGELDTAAIPALLNFEATAAVSREISGDLVSDECKMLVLYKVLLLLLDLKKEPRRRRYYKNFVPIVVNGLQSAAQLAARGESESSKAVDIVWTKFCICLSDILSPVPIGKDMLKIPRVHEILEIVACARSNVPADYHTGLCSIICHGGAEAFDVAKQHAVNAKFDPMGDLGRKSKRHRDDLLKLFAVCFSGGCALNPEDPSLRSIASDALNGAIDVSDDSRRGVCVEASLTVCRAMGENKDMETIVISVFPVLCNLVVSDDKELRDAVRNLFMEANVAGTLERARQRYEIAERRTTEAEKRIDGLEAAVHDLQQEKSKLQLEIAVLETSNTH
jgi:hypothetical protein